MQTMDVRDMRDIPDSSFEYAIDKGTLDSLLCGANSTQNVYKYLTEVTTPHSPRGMNGLCYCCS